MRKFVKEFVLNIQHVMDDQIDVDPLKVEKDEVLECDMCPKQCCSQKELIKHKYQAHLDKREYTCKECGEILKGERAFYNHKRRHKTFQCPKCGKTLSSDGKARHIRGCNGVKDKVKRCEHEGCYYTTNKLFNIKSHVLSHRKLICDVDGCDQVLYGKKNLDTHIRELHPLILVPNNRLKKEPKEPKIHGCGRCSYVTRVTTNLRSHEKSCAAKDRAAIVLVF